MRAAAFAPRPCRRRDQQRRGRHVTQRDIGGVPFDACERADRLSQPVTMADHADMRSHDRPKAFLFQCRHGKVLLIH